MQYIKNVDSGNFFLLAGPCVVESRDMCFDIAKRIIEITDRLEIPYIFKASYRKANRSRLDSFSGIGDETALEILCDIRETLKIPVVTDIHNPEEAAITVRYGIDVLQIPAFLCRQTDLLIAAAETGKVINIKKGQFASPESMVFAVNKVRESGNQKVMLTDRGTSFGYHDLIVDFRGIVEMKKNNCPVILDVTHSLQQPNQISGVTGGRPDFIETIARAGVAVGIDGIFVETHPHPQIAKSDGANMLQLDLLEGVLTRLVKIRKTINEL
ncbi:MAG: 3-deoxy-8-phosphooctulonate synthase [Prevotellaceae bacterium]|nr:3-deoxy-8-phosphooctulonate synthase [Prevotellaceae bacterium]